MGLTHIHRSAQAALVLSIAALLFSAVAANADTLRASTSSSGAQVAHESAATAISANGRYVVFSSSSPNLVAGDINGSVDVFVKDLLTDQITCVSTPSNSNQPAGAATDRTSFGANAVSADGRYVAFASGSSTLTPNDTNHSGDVFVKDTEFGSTRLVSRGTSNTPANGTSDQPSISDDGRFVEFNSSASNLVANDNNHAEDVFVRDLYQGGTQRASTSTGGHEAQQLHPLGPTDFLATETAISGDGKIAVFASSLGNLVEGEQGGSLSVYAKNLKTDETTLVARASGWPTTDFDGSRIAFAAPGDIHAFDVSVADRSRGTTRLVSSDNRGRRGNRASSAPSISNDGRYVAFASLADNLTGDDSNQSSDVYVKDLQTRGIARIGSTSSGKTAGTTYWPDISADGAFISFESTATDLVAGDSNGVRDVFRASRPATPAAPPLELDDSDTATVPCSVTQNCPREIHEPIYVPWPREFEDPRTWPYSKLALRKNGTVKFSITSSSAAFVKGKLALRSGKRLIGKVEVTIAPKQKATVAIKLSAAARIQIKHRGKLKLSVTFTDTKSGKVSSAKSLTVVQPR